LPEEQAGKNNVTTDVLCTWACRC